jgi:hypothetical protein
MEWFRAIAAAILALSGLGCRSSSAKAGDDAGAAASSETEPKAAPPRPYLQVSAAPFRERPIAPAVWLGASRRGALVRMGHRRAVAVADAGETRLLSPSGAVLGRWPGSGAVEFVTAVDLSGDGDEKIIVGRSGGRGGAMSVVVIDPVHPDASPEPLDTPASPRPEPVSAFVRRGEAGLRELYLAAFDATHFVTLTRQMRSSGAWRRDPLAHIRMAVDFAAGDIDPAPGEEIVVGRMYGDTIDAIGDVQVIDALGAPVGIAITGGVRAVAVADIDADGRPEVIAADGWDPDYGHKARALIDVLHLGAGASQPRREPALEWPGHSTFRRLVAADLDGDGRAEIIALRGGEDMGPPLLLRRSSEGVFSAALLGDAPVEDVVVGVLDGEARRPDILLLGDAPAIIHGRDESGP